VPSNNSVLVGTEVKAVLVVLSEVGSLVSVCSVPFTTLLISPANLKVAFEAVVDTFHWAFKVTEFIVAPAGI